MVEIVRLKTGQDVVESSDISWILEVFGDPVLITRASVEDDADEKYGAPKAKVATAVRNMWELECLVKALDAIETVSGIAQLVRE